MKIPLGYQQITFGMVEIGDLLWDEIDGWSPAVILEVGSPVSAYKAVCRKIIGQ